jgi:hypothetical protein
MLLFSGLRFSLHFVLFSFLHLMFSRVSVLDISSVGFVVVVILGCVATVRLVSYIGCTIYKPPLFVAGFKVVPRSDKAALFDAFLLFSIFIL